MTRPAREHTDGAALLDEVEAFMRRFVAFPTEHAVVAAVLWVAHAHLLDVFDSTPRLGYLSPEPGSGKTRALEITELLVPNPMLAVSASTAALFRAVADLAGRPTILFDEIDTVFGPKAKENEELRGLLNAGHRRSGVSYRCVGDGANQKVVAFPSYAALAMGGLGSLPDTILTRSVIIRMRRRAPGETVEPYRQRIHEPEGHALRKRLAEWAELIKPEITGVYPEMPEGVNDRPADVWEPLLTVADAAGQAWPERARAACVELVASATPDSVSLGVRLLIDVREVFEQREELFTAELLAKLHALDNAPWSELKGKPLNEYGLGRFLRDYEIRSKTIRIGEHKAKGYERADFTDAWSRYCPVPAPAKSVASVASVTPQLSDTPGATLPEPATDRSVAPAQSVAAHTPVTSTATHATDATDSRQAAPPCQHCGEPLLSATDTTPGTRLHTWCATWATPVAEPLPTPGGWPAPTYKRLPLEPS